MFAIILNLIQASNQVMNSKTLIGRNFNKKDPESKQSYACLLLGFHTSKPVKMNRNVTP